MKHCKGPLRDYPSIYILFRFDSISTFDRFVYAYMSSTHWWLFVRTTQPVVLATLSQWPHQRTTQRNRNDRLFIIAQPLCRGGEINYKNTTNSKDNSSVLYCVGTSQLFFSLKGLLTSPASPWCNLLPISNPIAFWNWIYLSHSHSEWTLLPVEKKKKEILCEIAWGVRRFWIRRYFSLSAINLPTGRMSSLHGRTGGFLGLREEVRARTGHWNKEGDKNGNVYNVLKVEAHASCSVTLIIMCNYKGHKCKSFSYYTN